MSLILQRRKVWRQILQKKQLLNHFLLWSKNLEYTICGSTIEIYYQFLWDQLVSSNYHLKLSNLARSALFTVSRECTQTSLLCNIYTAHCIYCEIDITVFMRSHTCFVL